jgi:hypothetical protein
MFLSQKQQNVTASLEQIEPIIILWKPVTDCGKHEREREREAM